MSAPSNNFALYFVIFGLLLVSLFFLTSKPFGITNVVFGVFPIFLLVVFAVTIWRAVRKQKKSVREEADL